MKSTDKDTEICELKIALAKAIEEIRELKIALAAAAKAAEDAAAVTAKAVEVALAKAAEAAAAATAKAVEVALANERYMRFIEERHLIEMHAKVGRFAISCRSWHDLSMC